MDDYGNMFLVSGDYEVQYRYRGLCPGRQDLANNHINPVIRSVNLIVAPSRQLSFLNDLLSYVLPLSLSQKYRRVGLIFYTPGVNLASEPFLIMLRSLNRISTYYHHVNCQWQEMSGFDKPDFYEIHFKISQSHGSCLD